MIKKLIRSSINNNKKLSQDCMDCFKLRRNETFIHLNVEDETAYESISIHHKNRLIAMKIPVEKSPLKQENNKSKVITKNKKKSKTARKIIIATQDVNQNVTFERQKLWAQAYVYGGR